MLRLPGVTDAPPGPGVRGRRSSLVLGVLVLTAVVSTRWVRLNISPSLPYGLYRLASVPAAVPRGALVVVPVPASLQPWWSAWTPFLKPVAAVAGDTICLDDGELWIGSICYGHLVHPAHHRPVPHIAQGCFVVPSGSVFLASHAPRSLDSRYFGPVAIELLRAVALPLLTFGGTPHGTTQ